MDAILGKMTLVEEGTQKATRLDESVAELDAQISRVSARVPFVEKLEGRLNGLNGLSADVDRKLEEQLARRAELDTLKTRAATASARRWSTRSTSSRRSARCRPRWCRSSPRSTRSRPRSTTARGARSAASKFDEAADHRAGEAARRAGRGQQGRRDRGGRARPPDAGARPRSSRARRASRTSCSPSSIASRAGSATRSARSRRPRISSRAPRRCSSSSSSGARRWRSARRSWPPSRSRLAEIKQVADELDKSIQSIASREQLVHAVKAEVESVHEISARSKADLAHVTEHRGEVVGAQDAGGRAALAHRRNRRAHRRHRRPPQAGRRGADQGQRHRRTCWTTSGSTSRRWASRRPSSTTWPRRSAQLEFMLQEARNTLRTLQHERELAERIEQGIKQLRAGRRSRADEGEEDARRAGRGYVSSRGFAAIDRQPICPAAMRVVRHRGSRS